MKHYADLIIEFVSTGYYDPGSMYGGPDNLGSPPEGEDERTLTEAYLVTAESDHLKLPQDVQQALFEHYEAKIYEADLDDNEPDFDEE